MKRITALPILDSTRFQREKKIETRILNFSVPPQELVAIVIKIVIFAAMSQNEPEHDPPPESCKLLCAPLHLTCVGQARPWLVRTHSGVFPSGGTCRRRKICLEASLFRSMVKPILRSLRTSTIPVSRLACA